MLRNLRVQLQAEKRPMASEPIRARLIDRNTIASGGVTLTALDPITALCRRLTQLGHDPSLSLKVWSGHRVWKVVHSIGAPDAPSRPKRGGE